MRVHVLGVFCLPMMMVVFASQPRSFIVVSRSHTKPLNSTEHTTTDVSNLRVADTLRLACRREQREHLRGGKEARRD